MKIAVTGHRPNKLYGYNLDDSRWVALKDKFKDLLIFYGATEAITGMALGVDMVFSIAVLELKSEGYEIKLHCAVPCYGQDSKWGFKDRQLYQYILMKADKIVYVSESYYNSSVMQKRNEYMVDLCDVLFSVWDGSASGTGNCVAYAKSIGKDVINLL